MDLGAGEFRIDDDNGLARVTLSGEFDLANVADLAAVVADVLWPASDVLVDLTDVTYLDAQLLHWLTDLQRQAHARNGAMVVRPGRDAMRLLTALRLTHKFELVSSA